MAVPASPCRRCAWTTARYERMERSRMPKHGEQLSTEERAVLAPYVTNLERPVFALRHLPEEVVAVLFAYYSRSHDSLRRNLLKLITEGDLALLGDHTAATTKQSDLAYAREKARQFREKWVVGYGHASVAEHAIAHIAIEDVSIVTSKIIEDNRLASYPEKSTGYVVFDAEKYYQAPELDGTSYEPHYREAVSAMMKAYAEL